MGEMDVDTVVVVRPERTARTAFLPIGAEHEVIDHELTAALEQIRKAHAAVRAIELIGLLDPHPRHCPTARGESLTLLRKFLFLKEQLATGGEPLFTGNYRRILKVGFFFVLC